MYTVSLCIKLEMKSVVELDDCFFRWPQMGIYHTVEEASYCMMM